MQHAAVFKNTVSVLATHLLLTATGLCIEASTPVEGKFRRHNMAVYESLSLCNTNTIGVTAAFDAASMLGESVQSLQAADKIMSDQAAAIGMTSMKANIVRSFRAADEMMRRQAVPLDTRSMSETAARSLRAGDQSRDAQRVVLTCHTDSSQYQGEPPKVGFRRAAVQALAPEVLPAMARVMYLRPRPFPVVSRSPVVLRPAPRDPLGEKNTEFLSQTIKANVFDVARTHNHKRDPSMRTELAWIIHSAPASGEAEAAFGWFLDGFPGRNEGERTANALTWSEQYQGGQYQSDVLCGAAYRYYRQASYDQAVSYADRYLARFQENADRMKLLKAMSYSQKNDFKAAREMLDAVEKEHSDSAAVPQIVFLRGWTYLNEKEIPKARAIFEQLVKDYPDDDFSQKARKLLETIKK